MVRTSLGNLSDVGMLEPEKRGWRAGCNQQRDSVIRDLVKAHIDRFPRIKSHYCRKNSDRQYLSSDLTISKMHRMYCDGQSDEKNSVNYTFYSQTFHEKNLIYRPKKDQRTLCNAYRTGDETTKESLWTKYQSHIGEKESVRKIKEQCKKESIESQHVASAVFDLEQVFTFSVSLESLVFYKRRLTGFNLTVYDLGTN